MSETKICQDCGRTVDIVDGNSIHTPTALSLSEDLAQFEARLKCCSCGSSVRFVTAKKQGFENWTLIAMTNALLCPGCSHSVKYRV